ncbi:dynactin subunit 5 [Plasmodium brasilianum]|uniref:Dynactin subunit 5 n=2 Tax=Plasmodium (Plasmodium) TaxID=418103 RepID=A0A1A8VTJ1_PLAMA|nr:dynactin subunit 5, putative [Plasmodium malariae]KAI4840776.1 dynactin subunit 5 [Plasmodium brasilianum]SBS82134.1 dynactin subunit 5, putative [Plasmodium malariae]SBT70483.1 dynactin subunit 5, putative [Plasmodium malariae]SBT86343.1 dynactin subunit 5, putative [Plasmodium malariae]
MDLTNLISDSYVESYNTATFQKCEQFSRSDYILTASGNKVCKDSTLCGMKNIHMLGKSIIKNKAILRGDLSSLYFGKYVIIGRKTLICPCFISNKESLNNTAHINTDRNNPNEENKLNKSLYVPVSIGNYVYIGNDCIVKAALIGNNVIIGNNCVIGERVVIKDNVIIKDNTFIPNDTNIAPFSKYAGCPAKFVKLLPESAEMFLKDIPYMHYKNFTPEI